LLQKHIKKGGISNADPLSERYKEVILKHPTIIPVPVETVESSQKEKNIIKLKKRKREFSV